MKNKHTIILIILCLTFNFIYIFDISYKNSDNFSVQVSKIDNTQIYSTDETLTTKDNFTTENSTDYTTQATSNIHSNNKLININTADKETLKTLPNIGDTIAQNIIEYREKVSLFYDISDIKNVDRIGEKTYNKIKDLITVN